MFYYNPLVLKVLQTLIFDPHFFKEEREDNLSVFYYPIEQDLDLTQANQTLLERFGLNLTEEGPNTDLK